MESGNPATTRAWGERLGRLAAGGDFIALLGEIGAGKTVFAQGLLAGLGVADPLGSPTFNLVHEYRGRVPVYHVDLYRLGEAAAGEDLGYDEILYGSGVAVVEWAELVRSLWPKERVEVAITRPVEPNESLRRLVFTGRGARGSALVGALRDDDGREGANIPGKGEAGADSGP